MTRCSTIAVQSAKFQGRCELIESVVQPAGIRCRVEKEIPSEEYKGKMLSVVGDTDDVRDRRRKHILLPTSEEVEEAHVGIPKLGYWRGYTDHVRADSPLGALRDLGNYLTKRYQGWRATYATRFVLTGDAPELRPLVVERQALL